MNLSHSSHLKDNSYEETGMHTLILGGAKSGKSSYALKMGEDLIEAGLRHNKDDMTDTGLFIATAQAHDREMEDRIRRHREERGSQWKTVEEPLKISGIINSARSKYRVIIVDCLTLWLTNIIYSSGSVKQYISELRATLTGLDIPVIMVSNEVGLGIVPAAPETRGFRDHAGKMNQDMASICQRVIFIVAGIPMYLKGEELASSTAV